MIVKEKRRRIVAQNKETRAEAIVFALRAAEKSYQYCTVCTDIGHVASKCYQVIGFPEWWRKLGGSNSSSGAGKRGCNGGRPGRGIGG